MIRLPIYRDIVNNGMWAGPGVLFRMGPYPRLVQFRDTMENTATLLLVRVNP